MNRLELYDTVVFKADRSLYGTVERVHLDGEDALDDCLIVAHVPVDPEALAAFIKTGIPPRDHVFVMLADVALGHALVSEDQVELIDRTFAYGDYVKQKGNSMLGSVVDFSETFVLQPLWKCCQDSGIEGWSVVATADATSTPSHVCTESCNLPTLESNPDALSSDLIFGVPGQELRKASDTNEGNLLIKDDFVGVVDELMQSVTLIMEDGSIVVVSEPDELYVPLPDFGNKPLVSLPEFDPDVRRPDFVVAQHGWSATVPLPHDEHHSGQLIVTNGRNLRTGRWLRGKYNKDLPHQGRIIDVRSREVHTRWVAVNPFVRTKQLNYPCPDVEVELYENINTFPNRSELRRNKTVMAFDMSKTPRETEDRRRKPIAFTTDTTKPRLTTPTDIQVGDQVKFRDQAGAAVKYQGTLSSDGVRHGAFERISPSQAFGFDVNDLKVVHSQQHVTVRWQDGTVSMHKSTMLYKYDLFDTDFMPADMVVAREGMMQRPFGLSLTPIETPSSPYNEMTVFERPHELHPSKVGILQSVDPVERVAQIKWYKNPSISILGADHSVFDRHSRLGELDEQIEDVSLYEIMTFPALTRQLKDLVIVAPKQISQSAKDMLKDVLDSVPGMGTANASLVQPRLRLLWARYVAAGVLDTNEHDTSTSNSSGPQSPDWCGEIIHLDTDGSVTVRINAGDYSKDVLVERDQFIVYIDEAVLGWGGDSYSQDSEFGHGPPSENMWLDSSDDERLTISESIEYEGGRRLDDDSDDENWDDEEDDVEMAEAEVADRPVAETVSEGGFSLSNLKNSDHATGVGDTVMSGVQAQKGQDTAISRLCSRLGQEKPPPFAVLDETPPSDQFQQSADLPTASPAFAKRMLKEHKILATSLPEGEIYVRTYESRVDLMRCLIIGPPDTPFEHAPFVFDLQFTSKFPSQPPIAHFHSWTHGLGRINPNLYEEGKICLSLLGTWQGKGESESWTEKATVLQLLVSLQGLVFVARPFYNEAGYEEAAADDEYRVESLRYNEKVYVMARAFVKHALRNVVEGLEDVLAWTYLVVPPPHGQNVANSNDDTTTITTTTPPNLLNKVIVRARSLIDESERYASTSNGGTEDDNNNNNLRWTLVDGAGSSRNDPTKSFMHLLSRGAMVMLKKTLLNLNEIVELVETKKGELID